MGKKIFSKEVGAKKTSKVILEMTQLDPELRIDIREWFEQDGKMIPTKKGISLPFEMIPSLISALQEAQKQKK